MADHAVYGTTAERYVAEPHTFDMNLVQTVFDEAGNAYKRFGDGSYVPWVQPAYHQVRKFTHLELSSILH